MKKLFIISCAIISSHVIANQPQKNNVSANKQDLSFYAQCVKPNVDALKKKYEVTKPTIDKHKKTVINYYTELSKTNEYAIAKICLGVALLTDSYIHRAAYNRSELRNVAQVTAGLYLTTSLVKQVYNDVVKKK